MRVFGFGYLTARVCEGLLQCSDWACSVGCRVDNKGYSRSVKDKLPLPRKVACDNKFLIASCVVEDGALVNWVLGTGCRTCW